MVAWFLTALVGCGASLETTTSKLITSSEILVSEISKAIDARDLGEQKKLEGNPLTNEERAEARKRVADYRAKRDLGMKLLVELDSMCKLGPPLLSAYAFGVQSKADVQKFATEMFEKLRDELNALRSMGIIIGGISPQNAGK